MFGWLSLGGPIMILLAVMSVAAMTLIIIKLWDFSERRSTDRDFLDPAFVAWDQGYLASAREILSRSPAPLAAVLLTGMDSLSDPRLTAVQARERVERMAINQLEAARQHLRTLDLIASLAPLVGLLGTVLGMIEAFQALEVAAHRVEPAILSGGIWQALLTTAAGLGIAIPTTAFLNFFEGKVDQQRQDMETQLTRLFTEPSGGQAPAGAVP